MILITVGTDEHPFDRLVEAAGALASMERVIVQSGTSSARPAGCEMHGLVAPSILSGWLAEARVVICHGGPSTIREAWAAGHRPIVVPRDPARGEHVDDHQRQYAASLGDRVRVVEDESLLFEAAVAGTRSGVGVVASVDLDARRSAHLGRIVAALVTRR